MTLGLAGMPRRIPDYNPQFADFNLIASVGGFMFGVTQLLFLFIVTRCSWRAKGCRQTVERAHGLEWMVPSPAPHHTFPRHQKSSSGQKANIDPAHRTVIKATAVAVAVCVRVRGWCRSTMCSVILPPNGKTDANPYTAVPAQIDTSRTITVQFLAPTTAIWIGIFAPAPMKSNCIPVPSVR